MNKKQITTEIENSLENSERLDEYWKTVRDNLKSNSKNLNFLSLGLVLLFFSYPILDEGILQEINVGPIKLKDKEVFLRLVPLLFTFIFFRMVSLWSEQTDLRFLYQHLSSKIFSIEEEGILNKAILPFSFMLSTFKYQDKGSKTISVLFTLILLPVYLIIIFGPFIYEIYLVGIFFQQMNTSSNLDWILLGISGIFILATILFILQIIATSLKASLSENESSTT